MQVVTLTSDGFQENTYILILDKEIIIIDPGVEKDKIKSELLKYNKKLKYILLTHGHYDHILSANFFNTLIYAHEDEKLLIEDEEMNLSILLMNKKLILKNVKYYSGGKFEIDNFEVYHTPGHTSGSVIIKYGNNLFTGDTLFLNTVGRSDLPTGNSKILQKSLQIFKCFDKRTICYPGHGNPFKLEDAFKYNYFLINN